MPKGLQGFQKGNKYGVRFERGQMSWNKGKSMSEKQKQKLREVWDKKKIVKHCLECGNIFKVSPCFNHKKFCSRACHFKNIHKQAQINTQLRLQKKLNAPQKKRIAWNKGKKCPQLSECQKGRKATKGSFKAGILHHNWKGGKCRNKQYLSNPKYRKWRLKVFMRDNFTCVSCGKVGGHLEAHHIKRWIQYPKLRYVVENGITLCKECHKLTDNYGNKRN